ncbi:MAG: hypothetical protein HY609_05175 [Deltaproteobacteria bacterium]|nr:hypothetical protein [Deltaproteobacteria bacterium]MBI4224304.1 hypothetical protein [Deltaproteobacteria bacterium]
MDPVTAIFVIGTLLGVAGCGSSGPSSRPDREEQDPPDGGSDLSADGPEPLPVDGGDGGMIGADAEADAMPPRREKINDRWAEFEDCVLADLVLADEKLYALCEGNPHRLVQCDPADEDLEPAACDDFVLFEDLPHLDGKPLEIAPLVHNVLNDRYSVVTFTSVPDNYPGFFVVDRTTREITDQRAWEAPGIRVGSDIIEFPSNLPWGSALLGDNLLIAARNRDFETAGENYYGGMFLYFDWNGDGTVGIPEEAELGVAFRFTNGLNPTLFRPDGSTAKLLNNQHRGGASPLSSGWDRIALDGDGRPVIDEDDFQSLGAISFEPFKHFAASPDGSAVFLASRPNLYVYQPAAHSLSDPYPWEDERVISAAWGGALGDRVFFAGESQAVFSASISDGGAVFASGGISLIGEPTASAIDLSQGIYYQGLIVDAAAGQSAITAMLDSIFDVE